MCSAVSPQQSTGMSQPPKSTIFAFAARCTEFNAVLRKGVASSDKIVASRFIVVCEHRMVNERAIANGLTLWHF
jgi:hypothetical protein